MRATPFVGVLAVVVGMVGCGGDDEANPFSGAARDGGAGSSGTAGRSSGGSSGAASGGSAGAAGTASGGTGGTGVGGSAGASGAGSGGVATGGAGGESGTGSGGVATGGASGASGTGSGGVATGGASGASGAGSGGVSGSDGTGGSGDASAGTAGVGTGGSGTGGSGTDASATGGTGGTDSGGSSGSSGAGGSSAGSGGSASGGTAGGGSGGTSSGGSSTGGSAGAAGTASGGTAGTGGPTCAIDGDCDDGLYCTGAEHCVNGTCVAGTPVNCPDDGHSCTAEVCDEANDKCSSVPQDSRCDDSTFCNGSEECSPGTAGAGADGCVAGTPPPCNDGVSCTDDSCDEANRRCKFTPVNSRCADATFCNGNETCDPVNGAQGTGCRAGTPVDCDDSIGCTADSCNEVTKGCDNLPNNLSCTNGQPCDGAEFCDPTPLTGGCKAGTPVSCPGDGITCSVEACNPLSGQCQTTYDNTKCPSGQTCTSGGCMAGATCNTSATCQDGNLCNGTEVCDTSTTPGICRPGTPKSCDDGIACTLNLCNPSTGACSFPPDNSICSDGDVCTGVETCDPTPVTGGCKDGTPLNCDDGIACTIDLCASGCTHLANDDACSDGLVCNGVESCDPTPGTGGCKAGTPPNCVEDGIACTDEVCTEPLGCHAVPDNSLCPCGQTCSVAQGACGNFCNVTQCSGKIYQCGDCLDNDGDCKIDSADSLCTGVCDNTENHLYPNLPGAPGAPCKLDCFFDNGNGSGNDNCYWDHRCDPLEVAPNYPPEGASCSYNSSAGAGPGLSCSQAMSQQPALCGSFCGPLVPNGCDCFGCCAIPGANTTVWLGSEDGSDDGTCTLAGLNNPALCKPCTQVPACLNTCGHCELCLGKPDLPPDCSIQDCPGGAQRCGIPGQLPCPSGYFCVTGCCQQAPGGGA